YLRWMVLVWQHHPRSPFRARHPYLSVTFRGLFGSVPREGASRTRIWTHSNPEFARCGLPHVIFSPHRSHQQVMVGTPRPLHARENGTRTVRGRVTRVPVWTVAFRAVSVFAYPVRVGACDMSPRGRQCGRGRSHTNNGWRSAVVVAAEGAADSSAAERLGIKPDMIVQEIGW